MIDETTGEVRGAQDAPLVNGADEEERIVTLYYRRSRDADALFSALAKAQAVFEKAEKAGENPHFRSRYATLESVLDATSKGRAEQGLAIIQMPTNHGDSAIAVTTLLGHASGQWIESTIAIVPMKLDAQGAGSVITYLRRYALMAILGIAAEDDDGEAASQRAQTTQQQTRQSAPLNPNSLSSREQRLALWGTILRAWGAESDEGRKKQASQWFENQRMQFKPPVLRPEELTVGHLRTIMEKVQEFQRSEGPQEEPAENGSDELADSFDEEAEEAEPKEKDKRKDKKGKGR